MKCLICNKEFNSNGGFGTHLKIKHSMSLLEYMCKYEGFEIPKCCICGNNAKQIRTTLSFRNTCGSKECISQVGERQKHSESTKSKIREKRLEYMKNNPEDTAWRLGNKPSYPEQKFIEALKLKGFYDRFDIVREKCVYPYYIDFAFLNVKVAVEIDGSQHELEEIKERDKRKEALLISNGWRVYRVSANKVLNKIDEVLEELIIFIGEFNNISKTSEILTDKERKILLKEAEKKNRLLKKQDKINNLKNLILNSNIDFSKLGWVKEVSLLTGIKHQKVSKWMKKYMKDFYEEKCFKRKPMTKN